MSRLSKIGYNKGGAAISQLRITCHRLITPKEREQITGLKDNDSAVVASNHLAQAVQKANGQYLKKKKSRSGSSCGTKRGEGGARKTNQDSLC